MDAKKNTGPVVDRKSAMSPTSTPTPSSGVNFVHATLGNFFARVPRTPEENHPPEAEKRSHQSPVPRGWAKSKEIAANEASSLAPGKSLSAMIGHHLANGLRRPSISPSSSEVDKSSRGI